jgi:hypothetical protein
MLAIECYTMKVAPAVSQKEILKHLNERKDFDEVNLAKLHQMKARIDLLCDPADLKKVDELPSGLSKRRVGVCARIAPIMAIPTCLRCGGLTFESKEASPRNSNFRLTFIQCAACGGVVGVLDYYNIGELLHTLARGLGVSLD